MQAADLADKNLFALYPEQTNAVCAECVYLHEISLLQNKKLLL